MSQGEKAVEALAWLAPVYDALGLFWEPMFLRRASLALGLLTLVTAGAGVLVVNLRLAYFAEAVGHTVLAGLALALVFSWPEKPAVLGVGAVAGLGVVGLTRHSRLAADTAIGLVFSGLIALSLALVSRHSGAARGLSRLILGDILTVTDEEILVLAGLALVTVIFLALFFNHLALESLSPTLARTRRPLLSRFLPYLFGLWLALTATVAVWSVGLLLVTALLVAPAAAGRAAASSARGMFWAAQAAAAASGQIGLYISTRPGLNTATGATVVLTAVFIFILVQAGASSSRRG
ncbi:MAG: metal ABC transporter permease [Candidatus Adiutrix sp.]|nr:metal ABC transporter permease [Candidatus Adiutrix sp.]